MEEKISNKHDKGYNWPTELYEPEQQTQVWNYIDSSMSYNQYGQGCRRTLKDHIYVSFDMVLHVALKQRVLNMSNPLIWGRKKIDAALKPH